MLELLNRFLAWRSRNMAHSPNAMLRYQGGWVGAAIGAVGSLMSADAGSDAAEEAAQAGAEASKYATDMQKAIYDQTRTDQAPWRLGGQSALYSLLSGMGLTTSSGGYFGDPVSETREQILARMTPSYTTTTTSEGSGSGEYDIYGNNKNANIYYNYEDEGGGFNPFRPYDKQRSGSGSGGGSTSTVDYNALNAAVDAEYARQQAAAKGRSAPAGFGDLSKKFSMADFQADPGYAFRVAEGQRGLDQSAAARGGLQSGNALKAAARYGQEMGSQEYGNAYNRFNNDQSTQYNRLSNIAGFGQTANNSLASAGANYANQVGNYAMTNGANQGNAALSAGNSRASSWAGLGNSLGKAVTGMNWGGGNSTGTDAQWGAMWDPSNS